MNFENSVANDSKLYKHQDTYDYADCFTIELNRNNIESWEPVAAFVQFSPTWPFL
jgi:hypothetical protein